MSKGNNSKPNRQQRGTKPAQHRLSPLAALIRMSLLPGLLVASQAYANPEGGTIVGGQGSIDQSATNTTLVTQDSGKLAIDWQSFNVDSGELVRFVQPSSSSSVLNRILQESPSTILGAIEANGRVYLINPNGVIFGEGSRVEVGSLVASGLDLSSDDFMNDKIKLRAINGEGGVVINRGLIKAATGGSVTLVGGKVINQGVIIADMGRVNLGAGQSATLDFDGDGLVRFAVDGEVLSNDDGSIAAVNNTGLIQADGGEVLLTASAAKDVFARVVNNEGVIQAGRIDNSGGVVRLVGAGAPTVNAGVIDVSGQDAGSTGGTVEVLGDAVGLFAGSAIDASGPAGGGTVLVGGDYHGANPDIKNAQYTYVAEGTTINADATDNGDGGKVIVWADNTTRFYGDISSRGGASGGDGGFVEVSGKQNLDFHGGIDVGAASGAGGVVLFDPENIILDNSTQTAPTDNAVSTPDIAFADPPDPGTTTVEIADVTGFSELYLQATNDITLSNDLTMAAGNSVLFQANNDINLNANLTVSGAGTVTLTADADTSGVGAITRGAAGNTISAGTGLVTLNAGSGITATTSADTIAFTNSTSGAVTINEANDVSISGSNTGGGAVNVTVAGAGNTLTVGAGNLTANTGSVDLKADEMTFTGTVTGNGGIALSPNAAGRAIRLGTGGGGSDLDFTQAALNQLNTTGTLTISTTGAMSTNGDIDFNKNTALIGSGLTLASNDDLTTSTNKSMTITTGSITFGNTNATIQAAGSTLTLINATGIGLGAATSGGGLDLTAQEISQLVATNTVFQTAGAISVDNLSDGDTDAIDSVTLSAGTTVTFQNNLARFDTLTVNAGTGIAVNAAVNADGDTGTGNLSMTTTTGNIAIGANIDANGTASLAATAGNITRTTGTINGTAINLSAGGGIGASGSAVVINNGATGNTFSTAGNGTAGDIFISSTGALNTNQFTSITTSGTGTQTVDLSAAGWTVGGNLGNASDNLKLTATGNNDISGGAGTLTAAALTLDATGGTGAGIGSSGSRVNVNATGYTLSTSGNTTAGDIFLASTSAQNTNQFTSITTSGTGTQTIDMQAAGWTVGGNLGNAGDDLVLTATGDNDIAGGAGTLTAAALTLNANGGTGAGIGTSGTPVSANATSYVLSTSGDGSAGDIYVSSTAAKNTNAYTLTTSGTGTQTVGLTAAGWTVGGNLGNASDNLTLTASGSNSISGGSTLTAAALTLNAATGISANTSADSISATNTTSGNVTLTEANDVTVTGSNTGGGSFDVTVSGATNTLTVGAGNITANTGSVTLSADEMTITGNVTGNGGITLRPTTSNTTITLGTGTGGLDFTDAELDRLFTTGTLTIGANTGNNVGAITIDAAVGPANASTVKLVTDANISDGLAGVGGSSFATNNLALDAGTGIDVTTLVNAVAATTASGAVRIDNSGAPLTVGNIAGVTGITGTTAGGVVLTNNNDITVSNAINSGTGTVAITTTGASSDIDGGASITAGTLTLDAGAGIGTTTGITTNATTLNLTTAGVGAAGDIDVTSSGALNTGNVTVTTAASTQTIDLTGASITVGAAFNQGTDNLLLTASGGSITDGTAGAGGNLVTAATLGLSATGGIDVTTAVGTVAAESTVSGDVRIDNTGALNVGSVGGITGITTTASDIIVTATDTLTVTEDISAASGGTVSLATTGGTGNIDGAGGTVSSDTTITLNAFGGIGQGGVLNVDLQGTGNLSLTTAGAGALGDIDLVEAGSMTTSRVTTLSTAGTAQTVDLGADDWTVDASRGNATDNLTLRATSGDVVGGAGTLTAAALNLTATGGIGIGTPVNVNASTYQMTTNGVGAAGDVNLVGTVAQNTNQFTSITTSGTGTQTVNLSAPAWTVGGNIGNAADDMTVTATSGGIAGGAGTITANNLDLTTAVAAAAIGASGTHVNTAVSGVLNATANNGAGGVFLSHAGNLSLGSIDAGSGDVELTSSGDITDGNADNPGDNVIGASVTLSAASGIGAGNPLEIMASTLNASTTSGPLLLSQDGDVTVTGLSTGNASDVGLVVDGVITQTGTVSSAGGDILLYSSSTDAPVGITMTGAATTTSGGGDVSYLVNGTGTATGGDINLRTIDAGAGNVAVITNLGAIINNGIVAPTPNVTGANLLIAATSTPNPAGILGNPIRVNLSGGITLAMPANTKLIWDGTAAGGVTSNPAALAGFDLGAFAGLFGITAQPFLADFGGFTGGASSQGSALADIGKGQTIGIEDLGYIDPSLFEELSLFGIVNPGIKLPEDQLEEELSWLMPENPHARQYMKASVQWHTGPQVSKVSTAPEPALAKASIEL